MLARVVSAWVAAVVITGGLLPVVVRYRADGVLTVVDSAVDGVLVVADVLGVGMPRPAGPGGALVGAVTSWSVQ